MWKIVAILIQINSFATLFGTSSRLYGGRQAMGHLAKININHMVTGEPYLDFYRIYFRSFLEPTMIKQLNHDGQPLDDEDWRVNSPMSDVCVRYLKISFILNNYKLQKLEDFVLLDSCLGYLYEDINYSLSDQGGDKKKIETINALKDNKRLRDIYDSTKLGDLSTNDAQQCLNQLLGDGMTLRKRNANEFCDDNWIELYLRFGNCYKTLSDSQSDSYVELLREHLSPLGANCFKLKRKEIYLKMEQWFKSESNTCLSKVKKRIYSNEVTKQSEKFHWPKRMLRILQVTEGKSINEPVDMVTIQSIAQSLKRHDRTAISLVLRHLEKYASDDISIYEASNDEEAKKAYANSIKKLCKPFLGKTQRSSSSSGKTKFQFRKMIKKLLEMNKIKTFLGIDTQRTLLMDETTATMMVPLYTTAFLCRYIKHFRIRKSRNITGDRYFELDVSDNIDTVMRDWPYTLG